MLDFFNYPVIRHIREQICSTNDHLNRTMIGVFQCNVVIRRQTALFDIKSYNDYIADNDRTLWNKLHRFILLRRLVNDKLLRRRSVNFNQCYLLNTDQMTQKT